MCKFGNFQVYITDLSCCKACNRCVKSRRVCPGYKDEATLLFRNYAPPKTAYWVSTELSDETLEKQALDLFLAEFVVESRDREQSRGFLDGMQSLLAGVDPDSSLTSAAKAVVLASIGNRTGRQTLIDHAQREYGKLLQKFTQSLSRDVEAVSIEILYTAVLLGIYEVRVLIIGSRHKAYVSQDHRERRISPHAA